VVGEYYRRELRKHFHAHLPLMRAKAGLIPRTHDPVLPVVRLVVGGVLFLLVTLRPTIAASQEVNAQDRGPNTGQDVFRPPLNLFQLMYGYRTAPGSGSSPGSIATVTTDEIRLRLDHRIDLSQQSMVVLRSDLPLVAKDPITSSNPNGDYLYSLGDADIQAIFAYNFNSRWVAGFGSRLIAPTGGDTLGSGKWQIMPIAGLRYALPEVSSGSYFEPYARYDVSFAGDPTKRNISNLQLAPLLTLRLPETWFISFYPSADIRVNFGDPVTGQTGRLFLPFDARVGRDLTDHIALSFEVGVPIIKDYPVYNVKAQVRVNVTW
jgi:hypothetical protein